MLPQVLTTGLERDKTETTLEFVNNIKLKFWYILGTYYMTIINI